MSLLLLGRTVLIYYYGNSNEMGSEIYYPVPFHLQECFKDLGHKKENFPISEFSADTYIALPIYPELSDEQINFVVKTFK